MDIKRAGESDWPIIEQIAQQSWQAGYAGVLSAEQISFMLNRSYSQEGIVGAMCAGQEFYLALEEDTVIGFIALQIHAGELLRIEKLYLLPQVQGKGYGRELLDFAAQQAVQNQLHRLELNVNRKNKAYFFYLNQGFEVVKEVDIPYFGFVLDDYVMQKSIAAAP